LGGPQAMAVGDQDHGRIPMPVAAMLSGAVDQPLDLALGEIASFNCQVYDVWSAALGCRFHAGKPCLRVSYFMGYMLFFLSRKARSGCMERIAIAMQDGGAGRVRGMRRRHEPRGQPHFVLPPNLYMGPPVGGLFGFKFSSKRHPRKLVRNDFWR